MAWARLRIDKYLEGESLLGGAMVEVRRLDVAAKDRRVLRVAVPMSERAEAAVNLDLGTYEFTAILPSGDVLTEQARVDDRANGVPVVFKMEHSPHEWLSWQHALGNVVSGLALDLARSRGVVDQPSAVQGVVARLVRRPVPVSGPDDVASALQDLLAGRGPRDPQDAFGPWEPLPQSYEDGPYRTFRVPGAMHVGYDQQAFPRSYALLRDASGCAVFCVLPWPWQRADGQEAKVELMVGPDQPLGADPGLLPATAPWSVSTVVRDDRVASALSYFTAGDETAAAFLAETALDLLFGKLLNPMAASAGAYILVDRWMRQLGTGNPPQWLSWVDNLAKWFPWLPDGQILRGAVALAGKDGRTALATARGAFVEAERRGIPLFTTGIRRLADGLTRIANQHNADGLKDHEVTDALQRVRRIAGCADPRFPFATLRLPSDVMPGAR